MDDKYKTLSNILDTYVLLIDNFSTNSIKMNECINKMLNIAKEIDGKILEDVERILSVNESLFENQKDESLLFELKKSCLLLKNNLWEL